MRTIENIKKFLSPVETPQKKLLPTLFNDLKISNELRKLTALSCKLSGVGTFNSKDNVTEDYTAIRKKIQGI